jgi:hypothetical protein
MGAFCGRAGAVFNGHDPRQRLQPAHR